MTQCDSDTKTLRPTHPWLFCIDSDGCAIDSMDIKHRRCFGPAAVETWPEWTLPHDEFLDLWNEINLFTTSRGINRFKGLVMIFEIWRERGRAVPDFAVLKRWASDTPALSPAALEAYARRHPQPFFDEALAWSRRVNRCISELGAQDSPAYAGVAQALRALAGHADIAVVSSANKQAMLREWRHFGLADYAMVMYGQEDGTKSLCIKRLLELGYDARRVVMVGDALGDLQAAEENGVWFYPIVVRAEAASWRDLAGLWLERFLCGSFGEAQQSELKSAFKAALPPSYQRFIF